LDALETIHFSRSRYKKPIKKLILIATIQ